MSDQDPKVPPANAEETPTRSEPARPWWRRPQALVAAAVALVVIAAGSTVLVLRHSRTDPGVTACKTFAGESGVDSSTSTSTGKIAELRSEFAHSSDSTLRHAGVVFMDAVATVDTSQPTLDNALTNLAPILVDWGALTSACAQQHVTLPSVFPDTTVSPPPSTPAQPSEPTQPPIPAQPSAPPETTAPLSEGRIGGPFTFHSGGGVTDSGQSTPTDVTVTIKPFTCGIKGFHLPGDDLGNPPKTIHARAGMRYCKADLTIENTSQAPVGQLEFDGQLVTTDGTTYDYDQQATGDVGAAVTTGNSETYGDNTTPQLNPHQKALTTIVWAIPIGAAPAELDLGESSTTDPTTGDPAATTIPVETSQITWLHPQGQ